MALHEVLANRRDEVLRHWKAQVVGRIAPESMPTVELIDHIPDFIDEIIDALKHDASGTTVPCLGERPTAAGHGAQRLRLGFSLDAVTREYGALRDAIIATALKASAT